MFFLPLEHESTTVEKVISRLFSYAEIGMSFSIVRQASMFFWVHNASRRRRVEWKWTEKIGKNHPLVDFNYIHNFFFFSLRCRLVVRLVELVLNTRSHYSALVIVSLIYFWHFACSNNDVCLCSCHSVFLIIFLQFFLPFRTRWHFALYFFLNEMRCRTEDERRIYWRSKVSFADVVVCCPLFHSLLPSHHHDDSQLEFEHEIFHAKWDSLVVVLFFLEIENSFLVAHFKFFQLSMSKWYPRCKRIRRRHAGQDSFKISSAARNFRVIEN